MKTSVRKRIEREGLLQKGYIERGWVRKRFIGRGWVRKEGAYREVIGSGI